MKPIRALISKSWRHLHCLLLVGCAACTPSLSENNPATKPLYEMPDDSLAEVARYSYTRSQHGIPVTGTATLIVAREYLNKQSYVKTAQMKQRMPVVKIMLMKTLPGMNWDDRENLAMFCRNDLRPVRLAITAEEWRGNNYLEWIARGDEVSLLGRPYLEDGGRLTTQIAVKAGYFLYEQLPVLVRAVAKNDQPLTLRMIAPQTAYLLPHAHELQVELERLGVEKINTAAGDFSTIIVTVTPVDSSKYFPEPEEYWIDEHRHFIVKAKRNELIAGADDNVVVNRAVYELQDYRRMSYWQIAVPPATNSLDDRRRATHSSLMMMNIARTFAQEQGKAARFDNLVAWFDADSAPAEYLSAPKGNNRIAKKYDGKGGWWLNEKTGRFELNYRFESSRRFAIN